MILPTRLNVHGRSLFILMAFCLTSATGSKLVAQNETLVVTSRGLGTTAKDAEKDCLINAVQQAVGSFMDSETIIENDQIIKDKILTVSDGFVQSSEILSGPTKRGDGLFEVSMKVTVERGKVAERLKEVRITGQAVAGKDTAAEVITKIENIEQGEQLLEKYLDRITEKLLVARLIGKDGKPSQLARPVTKILPDKRIECEWIIQVYFDQKAFYEQASPQLEKVFNVLSLESAKSVVWKGERGLPWKIDHTDDFTLRLSGIQGTFPAFRNPRYAEENEKEKFSVTLSVGRDKFGQNERMRVFVFDTNSYGSVFKRLISSNAKPKLHFYLLDQQGKVILEEILDTTLKLEGFTDREFSSSILAPTQTPHPRWDAQTVLISPMFATFYQGSQIRGIINQEEFSYSDTVPITLRTVIDQEDLERISDVRFRFGE